MSVRDADHRYFLEGILLLTALTPSAPDLQKLVAFENAFDRVFSIIDAEGSLTHGGIAVQDCLSLLANLLRLNVSNQSYFRETGWVKKFQGLLKESLREQDSQDGVADWARPQRDKNIWGLLAVLRLFLIKGSIGTQANQISFWQNGVLTEVLEIAFHRSIDMSIRAEVSRCIYVRIHCEVDEAYIKALATSADLIRGNSRLQESFGQLEVVSPHDQEEVLQINGHAPTNTSPLHVNVLEALLDLALAAASSIQAFDVRLSACECIKAYLYGHGQIRLFFLRRAIDGHMSDVHEADNILTILIEDLENWRGTDPYRPWIASVLFFHLIYEDFDAKNTAMAVKDGDAENGEEVVTCIQALTGNMISAERKGEDERVAIGYLMILCGWLYEDHEGVNDFLGEGSNVQSIVQLVVQDDHSRFLVTGLCAFLLGIVYEFSTKDSPISRETLHQLLTSRLGREQYSDRITRLREHPMVRDFEVLPQGLNSCTPGGLPEVYFDRTFVDFLKDNFSRILRAIDRAPGIEVPVIANGIQKGVSRELVDSLRAQVEDRSQTIRKLESEIVTIERRLGQEQADHRKAKESTVIELGRIRNINDGLQRNHEEYLQKIATENQISQLEAHKSHESVMLSLQGELQKSKEDTQAAVARIQTRTDAEIDDLKSIIRSLESDLAKSNKDHIQDLQIAHEDYSTKTSSLESRLQRAEEKAADAEARSTQIQGDRDSKENSRKAVQAELDDLLMVLGDLEEKRSRDKVKSPIIDSMLVTNSYRNDCECWENKCPTVRKRRRERRKKKKQMR